MNFRKNNNSPENTFKYTFKGSIVFLGICILLGSCIMANKYHVETSNPAFSKLVSELELTNQKLDKMIELLSKNE